MPATPRRAAATRPIPSIGMKRLDITARDQWLQPLRGDRGGPWRAKGWCLVVSNVGKGSHGPTVLGGVPHLLEPGQRYTLHADRSHLGRLSSKPLKRSMPV